MTDPRGAPAAVDPVCGMTVDPADAAGPQEHGGRAYYFCCPHCLEKFRADPGRYLAGRADAPPAEAPPGSVYTCPMHPEVRQEEPGACPKCGMDLEPEAPPAGAADEAAPELAAMTRRFQAALALTVPVFVVAMADMIPGRPLHGLLSPQAAKVLQFLLATPVVFWAGWPLLVRGYRSLLTWNLNMFTLIALGVDVAYTYSVVATLAPGVFPESFRGHGGEPDVYFEAAAVILTLVLLGQLLELRARGRTSGAIRALLDLAPRTARRIEAGGAERDVPLEAVRPGDRLRIRPGECVPADGRVLEGTTSIDESMITGEPMSVGKAPGDAVIGGTVNQAGGVVILAERVDEGTLLAQIVRLVRQAQRSRAPIQRVADAVAAWFVPAVVAAAAVTFLAWAVFGPPPALAYALLNSIAVLIIACPCALGLATPISIMVGVGRGAEEGVLIRDAEALEVLAKVDTLVVDKTGTLTEGRPRLASVVAAGDAGVAEGDVLRLAAGLERASEHPLGAAILAGAEARGLRPDEVEDFESATGRGVAGRVEGRQVRLGTAAFLAEGGVDASALAEPAEDLRRRGQTVIFLAVDGRAAGLLGVADPVKTSTPEALRLLRDDRVEIVLVTGDNRTTAEAVARDLGLARVEAGVLPEGKADAVRRLQAEGRTVAMAGDGINDAPALAQAHVGIAMGTGTDVAMESAGVTLVKGDLRAIARARALSRATLRNIRQNLFFAFIYNALGITVAAGVLYPLTGLLLNPMIAAAAMSFSSASVVSNALRLRRAAL